MAEIVPAINVGSFAEVSRHIKIVEKYARTVHIDVADGSFTPEAVWNDARDLIGFQTPLIIEIHFMVAHPEEKIDPWLVTPARRIIFHVEATDDPGALAARIRGAKKEAAASIRPDSPWELLVPLAHSVDMLQTLAVPPGPSGQEFSRATLEKLKNLRARFPKMPLEVDGGIRVGVARECASAGADFIVVGSGFFSPEDAFEEKFDALADDITG